MAVNRKEVKKSRLLRLLVKAGKDRRQMVRQLCRLPEFMNNLGSVMEDVHWSASPQGTDYWLALYMATGEC